MFKVTTFAGYRTYTSRAKEVDLQKVKEFIAGENDDILQLIGFNKRQQDNLTYISNNKVALQEMDLIWFLKDRKDMSTYIKNGISSYSKENLGFESFNDTPGYDISVEYKKQTKGMNGIIKSNLPIIQSAQYDLTMGTNKSLENVIGHNGLLFIDIDRYECSRIDLYKFIESLSPVAILASPNGDPRPVFAVDVPESLIGQKKRYDKISAIHKLLFKNIEEIFKLNKIQIDSKCSNVNRSIYITKYTNNEFNISLFDNYKLYKLSNNDKNIIKNNPIEAEKIGEKIKIDYKDIEVEKDDKLKNEVLQIIRSVIKKCESIQYQPLYKEGSMNSEMYILKSNLMDLFTADECDDILCLFMSLNNIDNNIPIGYKTRGQEYIKSNMCRVQKNDKSTWKWIYSIEKRVNDKEKSIKEDFERTSLINKIDDILNECDTSSYLHICRKSINLNSPIDHIRNFWCYISGNPLIDGSKLRSSMAINKFISPFLRIKLNTISQQIIINDEVLPYNSPLSLDNIELQIENSLQSMLIYDSEKKEMEKMISYPVKSFLKTEVIKYFNPFQDWFDNLPKIETGSTAELKKVSEWMNRHTNNNSGKFFVDWCYGILINSLTPHYYDRILYIYSPVGGDGKTYLIQNELMPGLKSYISTDFHFNSTDKDDKLKITENIILIDDEGGNTKRKTDEIKKAISSKDKIGERLAFGRNKTIRIRVSSFVVLTNDEQISTVYNHDRRSLINDLKRSEWQKEGSWVNDFRQNIDIKRFWAELYNIFLAKGEDAKDFRFVSDEEVLNMTERYKQHNSDEELIKDNIGIPGTGEKFAVMSVSKITQYLERISGQKVKTNITGILNRLGFEQKRNNLGKSIGFKVKVIEPTATQNIKNDLFGIFGKN